jgi:DNA polymerase V
MAEVKAYRPESNSIGSGQVLHCAYEADKARLVVREMTDLLVLDLLDKRLVTDQLVLTVGYDIENLTDPDRKKKYKGPVTTDYYGRQVPKHAHGTVNLEKPTSSAGRILQAVTETYDRIVDTNLLVRRINITANRVIREDDVPKKESYEQLSLFSDYEEEKKHKEQEEKELQKERQAQEAILSIKKRFGKNTVLRGMNLEEGATAKDRNAQIGGHKA